MKTETKKLIETLQNDVNKHQLLWTEKIYEICESMNYHDSGKFSYNIDRLNRFVKELNDFEEHVKTKERNLKT